MRADSLPSQMPGIFVSKIEPASLQPIKSKLVSVTPSRNVRVATRGDIRIHANRNRRNFSAAPCIAFRFFQQYFQFRFGLDIEEEDAAAIVGLATSGRLRRVLQRVPYLVARLANA